MEASSVALLACAAAFVAAFLLIFLCKLGFNSKEVEKPKQIEEYSTKIKAAGEDYGTIEEGREAGDSGEWKEEEDTITAEDRRGRVYNRLLKQL